MPIISYELYVDSVTYWRIWKDFQILKYDIFLLTFDMSKGIAQIQRVRDSFLECKNNLTKLHGEWDSENDIRITMFSKCINVLNSALLAMYFSENCLFYKDLWISISNGKISDRDAQSIALNFSCL